MKHYALGWACNLNDVFVRFPYEKCKNLITNYKTKQLQRKKVKQVFRTAVEVIINDIIENNVTFKVPSLQSKGGEIHFEPVTGEEFKDLKAKGKFSGIDFLETLFTGYQLYLYIHGKNDNFLARKKFPIYISNHYKQKMENLVNQGKTYC